MQVREMQNNLRCVWRFYDWDPPGKALEALLCALRMKLRPTIMPVLDLQSCSLRCT